MNLEQAKQLKYGQHLVHKTAVNKSGKPLRVKVNGQPKTWKRTPEKVEVPVKYGLYEYARLNEEEMVDWELEQYTGVNTTK